MWDAVCFVRSRRWLSWLQRLLSSTKVLWGLWVWILLLFTDCWALGPQVCSGLSTNWERTGAVNGSALPLRHPYFSVHAHRQTCDFKQHFFYTDDRLPIYLIQLKWGCWVENYLPLRHAFKNSIYLSSSMSESELVRQSSFQTQNTTLTTVCNTVLYLR